jgi:hypothetical protein
LRLLPLPPFAIDTDETFAWRVRLSIERCLRNITDGHREIIQHVADMAEAWPGQLTHAQIAAQLNRGATMAAHCAAQGRK